MPLTLMVFGQDISGPDVVNASDGSPVTGVDVTVTVAALELSTFALLPRTQPIGVDAILSALGVMVSAPAVTSTPGENSDVAFASGPVAKFEYAVIFAGNVTPSDASVAAVTVKLPEAPAVAPMLPGWKSIKVLHWFCGPGGVAQNAASKLVESGVSTV